MALMSYLFLSELWAYLTPTVTSTLHVSNAADTFDMVTIHFNLTMHRLPCVVTSLDHQDVMGAHTMDMHGSVHKVRMAADGSVIGPYVQHEERAEIAAAAAAAAVAAPGAAAVDAKADAHGHGHDNGHSTHGHGHGAATPKMSALFAQDAAAQVGEGCRLEGTTGVHSAACTQAHCGLFKLHFTTCFCVVFFLYRLHPGEKGSWKLPRVCTRTRRPASAAIPFRLHGRVALGSLALVR
jgi:hypothetical protein